MVGRWTSKDPVRFESDGPNQYRYASNDPINYVDTNGLTSTLVVRPPPAVLGTGGAIVGGIAIGVAVADLLNDTVCRIQDIPDATPLPANDNAFPIPIPKVESPDNCNAKLTDCIGSPLNKPTGRFGYNVCRDCWNRCNAEKAWPATTYDGHACQ